MTQNNIIRIGLIGLGSVGTGVHYPGIQTAPGAQLTAIADSDPVRLQEKKQEWGEIATFQNPMDLIRHPETDAVILAVPNCHHRALATEAARQGKHVLCEKPLAMNLQDGALMLEAVQNAGIRHMTSFTYRFVPAMRYLKHLVTRGDLGQLRHFRSQRFQDWGNRYVGWRQWKDTAGTGELGDMASHRIDFGRYLVGEIRSVCAGMRQFVQRDKDEGGNPVRPSDTDDWVAIIGEFANGVTGVWESTKVAPGHLDGGRSHDFVEVNGSAASVIYELKHPYRIKIGHAGGVYETRPVPEEFLKVPASLRRAGEGDPERVWRYDQEVEFVQAIREGRECQPSFYDGYRCQAVMQAVQQSAKEKRWVEILD